MSIGDWFPCCVVTASVTPIFVTTNNTRSLQMSSFISAIIITLSPSLCHCVTWTCKSLSSFFLGHMEQLAVDSLQTCCWYVMRFCLICTGNTQWLFGGDGYCILKFLPSSTSLGQWCCHLAWSCSVPICLVQLLLCLPARSWCHICPSYCVTCSSGMLPTILLFFLVIWLCMVLYPMMCLILLMWWCLPDSLSWIDAGNPVLYLHPHG